MAPKCSSLLRPLLVNQTHIPRPQSLHSKTSLSFLMSVPISHSQNPLFSPQITLSFSLPGLYLKPQVHPISCLLGLNKGSTLHSARFRVRRYVYNDVVRLGDLQKLIDCSYVQSYTINSAKVVFLKQRPNTRPFKGSGNICLTCDRLLQEPFHFCSLSCKVGHVVARGEDISSILFRFDESDLAFSMDGHDLIDDDGQITPDSILEDPLQYRGCSSSGGGGSSGRGEECEVVKRKKKGGGFFPQIVLSLSSRRKGAPHRSPLS